MIHGPVQGVLEIQTDPGGTTRIVLDPEKADITAGGNGGLGDVVIKNGNGAEVARLGLIQELTFDPSQPTPTVVASYVGLRLRTANGIDLIRMGRMASPATQITPPDEIEVVVGGSGFSGTLRLVDTNGRDRFTIGKDADQDGRLAILDTNGQKVLNFVSDNAALYLGATGNGGDLVVRDGAGRDVIHLAGGSARLFVGAAGNGGEIVLRNGAGTQAIRLDPQNGALHLGGGGFLGGPPISGQLVMSGQGGFKSVHLDAGGGNLWLGGSGTGGDIILFPPSVMNQTDASKGTIHLKGDSGDILLRNADCAEEFDLASEAPEPGTVMVINDGGRVAESRVPYDKRVAGVVSGAGDYRPGIVLDRQETDFPRVRIALAGKAYCKADARYGPIEPGDLLTTSATPGHAMVATDPARAFGAVIGKALAPLSSGTALVPALITLQ